MIAVAAEDNRPEMQGRKPSIPKRTDKRASENMMMFIE